VLWDDFSGAGPQAVIAKIIAVTLSAFLMMGALHILNRTSSGSRCRAGGSRMPV
jgi:branched-subunit amino acid ABC-type transport system permease component